MMLLASRIYRDEIDHILAIYPGDRISRASRELLAFHIHDCLPDLVAYSALLRRLPELSEEDCFARKSAARKAVIGMVSHATHHLIAAQYALLGRGPEDRFGMDLWRDEPEESDEMYRPCPEEDCERPIDQCVCRRYEPIANEALSPGERLAYHVIFNGDANRDQVAQAAFHLTEMAPAVRTFVELFTQSQSVTSADLPEISQCIDPFFDSVPEHLAAIHKLYWRCSLSELVLVGPE
ncbi:MAG: hypothetical protein AWU57_79 [Marinobacter sp. T13-3]|nr:MAG: hypothetical protein AWU57_79 [Marinobacter sp. T13-3]